MGEAVFGTIGVIVGSLIPWFRETWSEWRERQRHARYLAIRVVCVLDQYADRCVEVVSDDGLSYGQRDPDGRLRPQVQRPDPPKFPIDVDWRSIDHELMYGLLSLPNEAVEANRSIDWIASELAGPPDYDEAFEARQFEYAVLGIRAIELAGSLQGKYEIPTRGQGKWNPLETLQKRKKEIEAERAE